MKLTKKQQLCKVIEAYEGVALDPTFLFDVQVKRFHEYKRQLMNALSIMDIYLSLKDGSLTDFTPTAFIFGAKSAPGCQRAKAIIRYINRVAKLVNSDPSVADKLKVVFVQNYNCSYAEHIIPAADVSKLYTLISKKSPSHERPDSRAVGIFILQWKRKGDGHVQTNSESSQRGAGSGDADGDVSHDLAGKFCPAGSGSGKYGCSEWIYD